MASSQAFLEKMTVRQEYRNLWHADLMNTVVADPAYCCFAMICSPCASYMLRRRALYDDMSRYICCAGYMPCSGRCGESSCPEVCLCTEVMCCFSNSVSSTRFLLQDEFNIQTTKCDNCIIGCMLCLNHLACLFSLVAFIVGSDELSEASHVLNCIADLVYCTVCACMQTQHKIEMDKRDGKFGGEPVMVVPPVQQMSRMDQPIPPTAGYPPGYAPGYAPPPPYGHYGYPPATAPPNLPPHAEGHPPPQGHGYPPQGEGYPPPPGQGYPSPQGEGYPPPQGHGYPPQGEGYPPLQGQGYPPPQGQGHPPVAHPPPLHAQGQPPVAHPPPLHAQGQPPVAHPPPLHAQGHPPQQGQDNAK